MASCAGSPGGIAFGTDMKKLQIVTAALFLIAWANTAFAQTPDYLTQNRAAARAAFAREKSNGVAGNGRCGGTSYGTGARSCGTATGGPVGGINSRN